MVELERTPSRPELPFSGMFTMIYGDPKIGKSTLASTFPSAFFIATEAGLRHLKVMKEPCSDWIKFKEIYKALKTPESRATYRTIVIDTVDLLYQACETHMCQSKGIAHPSEEDWGRGWSMVREEFQRGMSLLAAEGYGIVFISHSKLVEQNVRGIKIAQKQNSLSNQARRVINPLVDFIFYLANDVDRPESGVRRLYCQNTLQFECGSRQKYFPDAIDEVSYDGIQMAYEEALRTEEEMTSHE